MSESAGDPLLRYQRQMVLEGIGLAGQRKLAASRVLIVGAGGLGSWLAEYLARSGVGFLRLVDNDRVDLTNLHRQALYDEANAAAGEEKVHAAARRLRQINSNVTVEPVASRLNKENIASLASGVDLILDGTDNFASRFLVNDYAVKADMPWVFAGVVAAEAQVMAVLPGKTFCLRCLLGEPPQPCQDPNCRLAGVFGPAVAAVAALEAAEAIKLLTGQFNAASACLLKMDLWNSSIHRLDVTLRQPNSCPCCGQRDFEYLD